MTRSTFNPPRSNVAGTTVPDLTGQRFHGLTVIRQAPSQNRRVRYVVRCDCGRESLALGTHLRNGYTRACHNNADASGGPTDRCGALLWGDPRFPCEGFVGHTGHTWDIRGHQVESAS